MSTPVNTESIRLIDDIITISRATGISIINVGAAKGSFTCSAWGSVPVDVPVGWSYTFEKTQSGYAGILIDATGTEFCIVVN